VIVFLFRWFCVTQCGIRDGGYDILSRGWLVPCPFWERRSVKLEVSKVVLYWKWIVCLMLVEKLSEI